MGSTAASSNSTSFVDTVARELERDLDLYLSRIGSALGLPREEKHLGRIRQWVSRIYSRDFLKEPDDTHRKFLRVAYTRLFSLAAVVFALLALPVFRSLWPVMIGYSALLVGGALLTRYRIGTRTVFWLITLADIAAITFIVHQLGSVTTVAVVFFPMMISLLTILMGIVRGIVVALSGTIAYWIVVLLELKGDLPYSPLLGLSMPLYPFHGIPSYPVFVLFMAGLLNLGTAFIAGILVYEDEARRKVAESAVKTKNDLLAICSHDLKNLLVTVTGYSELLLRTAEESGTPDQAGYAKEIHSSGKRMLELIRDLLDGARLDAGTITLRSEPVSFGEIVRSVMETQSANAALRGVKIVTQVPEAAPVVEADRSKIVQIVTNLVQNAITFTPTGGKVTLAVARNGGALARCSIKDQGPGITPETRDILFDPGALARRRRETGRSLGVAMSTGLGLSICKRLVELHGGRIGVDTELGEGTTFWVELPLAAA